MKVLLVSGSYPPVRCGVGDYTAELAKALSHYHDITVLTSVKATAVSQPHLRVLNQIKKWSGFSVARAIMREIKVGQYDLVHWQFPTAEYCRSIIFYLLPAWLKLKKIRFVYTFHEYCAQYWLQRWGLKPALLCANAVIAVENTLKQNLLRHNRSLAAAKVNVIHIGANIAKSQASDKQITKLRGQLLPLTVGCQRLLAYFGFINASKNLAVVLQAMAALRADGKLQTRLLIIGEFNDQKCSPEYFATLQQIIADNNLGDYIHITGFIAKEQVGDYFRCADAAIMPFKGGVSVRNGSMLAARQEGVKIITTKPTTPCDFFNDDGFIFMDETVASVSEIITNLQEGVYDNINPQPIADMWEDIAKQHNQVYAQVLSK